VICLTPRSCRSDWQIGKSGVACFAALLEREQALQLAEVEAFWPARSALHGDQVRQGRDAHGGPEEFHLLGALPHRLEGIDAWHLSEQIDGPSISAEFPAVGSLIVGLPKNDRPAEPRT
jgi:hypothetical protein